MSSTALLHFNPLPIYHNPHKTFSPFPLKDRYDQADVSPATKFHHSPPLFANNISNLTICPSLASEFGVHSILLKCENARMGLPSFKVLGASWGVHNALCQLAQLPVSAPIQDLQNLFSRRVNNADKRDKSNDKDGCGTGVNSKFVDKDGQSKIWLICATEGNHGRAVAAMAGLFGVGCKVFVPAHMYESTRKLIRDQADSVDVIVVDGDYDTSVAEAWKMSVALGRMGIMIQDTSFEGYEEIPARIVEGYGTLLWEIEERFSHLRDNHDIDRYALTKQQVERGQKGTKTQITHVVTPIGVGSLGHAVVNWAKQIQLVDSQHDRNDSRGEQEIDARRVTVIAVEPENAACLQASLIKGKNVTIETKPSIMSGMCCGTVSPISFATLLAGVDASVTVGERECHENVLALEGLNNTARPDEKLDIGPCGAGCIAGLRKLCRDPDARARLEFDERSVIVVLSTEGRKEYPVPEEESHESPFLAAAGGFDGIGQ